jgi:hypothetical protein
VAVVALRGAVPAALDGGPGAVGLRRFARFPMDLVARGLLGDTLRRDAERFGIACFAMPPSMSTMKQSEGLACRRGGVVVIRSQRVIAAVALNRRMELELLLYAV